MQTEKSLHLHLFDVAVHYLTNMAHMFNSNHGDVQVRRAGKRKWMKEIVQLTNSYPNTFHVHIFSGLFRFYVTLFQISRKMLRSLWVSEAKICTHEKICRNFLIPNQLFFLLNLCQISWVCSKQSRSIPFLCSLSLTLFPVTTGEGSAT